MVPYPTGIFNLALEPTQNLGAIFALEMSKGGQLHANSLEFNLHTVTFEGNGLTFGHFHDNLPPSLVLFLATMDVAQEL